MIKKHKQYLGNGPPGPKASNKGDPFQRVNSRGDPGILEGSRGDPSFGISVRGDPNPLPNKKTHTIKPNFLVSFNEKSDARNTDCPKKLNGRGMCGWEGYGAGRREQGDWRPEKMVKWLWTLNTDH